MACRFIAAFNTTSCHDEVDLSLCFQDSVILYGICAVFMMLAGLYFLFGNNHQRNGCPGFWLLYTVKLVRAACTYCIVYIKPYVSLISLWLYSDTRTHAHTNTHTHTLTHTHTHTLAHTKIFLLVPVITGVCDLIFTIARGRTEEVQVAQFQYVTPVVIIVSMVIQAILCIIYTYDFASMKFL